jgi:hypothetical protein
LRFLIASRPEALIQDAFRPFLSLVLRIDLADIDGWFSDIERYLKNEFARIATEQQLDSLAWPGERIIHDIVTKSCGQFVYASTIIRFVGDEYGSAASQLKIVLGLKPSNGKSPFAELDALYTELLRPQPDPEFAMDCLAIVLARRGLPALYDLGQDDALLLNVDKDELHRKLRGLHSLLTFKPHINVHHLSFLDFLADPARSHQYHISERGGARRYLELITDAIIRYASRWSKQPNYHEAEHFAPEFGKLLGRRRNALPLPNQDWDEVLRPLSRHHQELLKLPNFDFLKRDIVTNAPFFKSSMIFCSSNLAAR